MSMKLFRRTCNTLTTSGVPSSASAMRILTRQKMCHFKAVPCPSLITPNRKEDTLATAQALPQHNGIESLWWIQMQFRPCSAKGCSRSGHIHFEDIEPRGRRCRKKMFSVFLTCSNTEEHCHERNINVAMCSTAFTFVGKTQLRLDGDTVNEL